jgi:hypothetical protein
MRSREKNNLGSRQRGDSNAKLKIRSDLSSRQVDDRRDFGWVKKLKFLKPSDVGGRKPGKQDQENNSRNVQPHSTPEMLRGVFPKSTMIAQLVS